MPKDIFYFSRSDRIATVFLLAVIVITTALRLFLKSPEPLSDSGMPADSLLILPVMEQQAKKAVRETPKTETDRNRSGSNRYVSTPAYGRRTESARQQTYNRRTESVQHQYSERKNEPSRQQTDDGSADTTYTPQLRYPVKHRPDSPVDLNHVDTTGLMSLPGIGPWYASRIVEYRERLGGYISVNQLAEIEGLPDPVLQWFMVSDTFCIRTVAVNSETLTGLRRHPYINFYQARAIIELRNQHGNLKGPERFSLLEEFSDQDLKRLKPYLSYE
jgi:DNA uptake protein ComE-like DNA-binding protein